MRLPAIVVVCGLPLAAGCGSGNSTSESRGAKSTTSDAPAIPQGDWWEWAASEPEATNPVADDSGEDCERNQDYDAWFLAGTFGGEATRRCTVPAGEDLVIPVLNLWSQDRKDCDEFMRDAEGSATFDGEAIDVERVAPDRIEFDAAEGNPVVDTSGPVRAYGCGHWVRVPAPDAGDHTLTVSGEAGEFALRVTYELTVE